MSPSCRQPREAHVLLKSRKKIEGSICLIGWCGSSDCRAAVVFVVVVFVVEQSHTDQVSAGGWSVSLAGLCARPATANLIQTKPISGPGRVESRLLPVVVVFVFNQRKVDKRGKQNTEREHSMKLEFIFHFQLIMFAFSASRLLAQTAAQSIKLGRLVRWLELNELRELFSIFRRRPKVVQTARYFRCVCLSEGRRGCSHQDDDDDGGQHDGAKLINRPHCSPCLRNIRKVHLAANEDDHHHHDHQ